MRSIGILVKNVPEKNCGDKKCPFHGHLKVRGRVFEGRVVSANMRDSVIVEWEYIRKASKYERYEKRKTRVAAHNPYCIHARKEDRVRIAECRPLSKTKKFVVIEKLGEKNEGNEHKNK